MATTPAPTPTPTPTPAPTPSPSALSSGAPAGGNDWLPEKYRVAKEDKSLDVEASARKLAEGYGELNKQLVTAGLPPKDPESYEIKAELPGGLKFDELKKDPLFAARLKGFHAKGISNGQLQAVLEAFGEYVASDRELAADECVEQLRGVWKDAQAYEANMGASFRVASVLAKKAGLTFDEIEQSGLGNNPTFVRLMASLGNEIKEDVPPANGGLPGGGGDFDAQVAAVDKELEGMPLHDARRPALLEKKLKLFESKVGKKPAPTVGA